MVLRKYLNNQLIITPKNINRVYKTKYTKRLVSLESNFIIKLKVLLIKT